MKINSGQLHFAVNRPKTFSVLALPISCDRNHLLYYSRSQRYFYNEWRRITVSDTRSIPPAYIHGIHPVKELVRTRPHEIDRIYIARAKESPALFGLLKEAKKLHLPYQLVPAKKIDFITKTKKNQGIAALCTIRPYNTIKEVYRKIETSRHAPLICIPASVEDPNNLGAIIRSCAAFDVDALLLERKHTAPFSASVAKSSAGAVEHLTIARPHNLEKVVADFKHKGFVVVGADMHAKQSVWLAEYTTPLIFIIGGEHRAIPPYLSKQCSCRVSIPLAKSVQSLNVSAATAILLYECSRQRNAIY
jgi:23S rRNA (guanosine2251-2'-O)-methyltransferase